MLDVGGLVRQFIVRRFIYGLPREVYACEAITLREGLLWLGSYD